MSYTYPEWVIPPSVDKSHLLLECEGALIAYSKQGFKSGLCLFSLQCGMGNLHRVLEATLTYRRSWMLEDYIEERNGFPRYLLDRNPGKLAERRVVWLNQLKEKLDGTE